MSYEHIDKIYYKYNYSLELSYENYTTQLLKLLKLRMILDDKKNIDDQIRKIYNEYMNSVDCYEQLLISRLEDINSITND